MNKAWKITGKICSGLLAIAAALAAVILVLPRAVGWKPFSVLSGSMEPVYPVGSLIYVKSVPAQEIQVGDVITFAISEKMAVTHRVTAIDEARQRFVTKGDANDVEDLSPVSFQNLIGRPVFSIPALGYVSGFLETARGKIVAISAFLVLAILMFLPDVLGRLDGKKAQGKGPVQDKEALR
ncbi:MAG: signal peptidase I [Oscillospiraceae bacterium]|nr:signal peptidase I [Oscillospiraceae bacterium]